MSTLYGNEKIQQALQDTAEDIVLNLLTTIRGRSYRLRHDLSLPDDAVVRTTYAGIKDIEGALSVFTLQYLKQEIEGGWPVVTLEYDQDNGAV